jgi:hypothetical protein
MEDGTIAWRDLLVLLLGLCEADGGARVGH